MIPIKHELLVELISNPLLREENFISSTLSDISSDDVLSFRKVLQFNEQELLINPFIHTKKYISYDEIEKISKIYFGKCGLHREMYTKKVKTYGLILFKYLLQSRKPLWLRDIAKYEFILFSQLWITGYNNDNLLNRQHISNHYLVNNLCRLGEFSFDIEAYMDNPETTEFLFKQKTNKYLVFIGNHETPSVSTKSIDTITYSLIRFCRQPRSILEINNFLRNQLSLNEKESTKISHSLTSLLESWNILNLFTTSAG
ncbi:hypothetical protein [Microcoleus sp. bin38.metabat.b11b12b14.051]|uniref:hypothetical protein n=1 Tax=Microcoleus sp. bin38.metabat.b11b12b14.051 TaxID=2742709 RepID=UPI0025D4AC44|nr:hypothetical protein [Microcoleus sp. bin38.metabat.b11b12b14.051]